MKRKLSALKQSLMLSVSAVVVCGLSASPAFAQQYNVDFALSLGTTDLFIPTFDVHIGYRRNGGLTVFDGVSFTSRTGRIGYLNSGNGNVLVEGENSRWQTVGFNGVISVAYLGTGKLTVSNGGLVSTSFGYIAEGSQSSDGTAIITGTNSHWENTESLYVAEQGKGALTISQGGRVSTGNWGGVARQAGSVGTASVDGNNSIWQNQGQFFVGEFGEGTLIVTNGGQVSAAGNSTIAWRSGSVGTASISGENSTWNTGGTLYVGLSGQGSLSIADQGKVNVKGGSGIAYVGSGGSATGVLNIGAAAGSSAAAAGVLNAKEVRINTSSSRLVFNHTDTNYVFTPLIKGKGGIEVYSGTTTLNGNNTYTGATSVNGGTLLVNGSTGSGTVNVNAGGTLGGTGTIGGTANINASGTLSAGTSPGTLTITGDLILDAESTSEFELGQPDTANSDKNDLVIVEGNAEIGGTLNLSDGAGGIAVSGLYTLFEVAGTTTGSFATVNNNGAVSTIEQIITNSGQAPSEFNILVNNGQQVQFWDGPGLSANDSVDGGTGTWNADNTNWTTEAGDANSKWLSGVGIFQGTAGEVSIAGTQDFQGLQFRTDGYILSGGTINMTGDSEGDESASFLNADAGTSTTIASVISGDAGIGVDKFGSGTIILTGVNTYTGTTTIKGGRLEVTDIGSLASTTIDIENGTFRTDGNALNSGASVKVSEIGTFDVDGDETITALNNVGGKVDIAAGQTLSAGTVQNAPGAVITNVGTLTSNNPIANSQGATITSTGAINASINNAGTLNASGSINGNVTNTGSFAAGGTGTVASASITGNYNQSAAGVLEVDVDAAAGTHDLVTISGSAELSGTVDVNLINGSPLGTLTILSATQGVTDNGLVLGELTGVLNPLAELKLLFPTTSEVALGFQLNVGTGNFNRNQTNLLNHINAINAAGPGSVGPVITGLFNLGNAEETAAALDQLSPEVYLNSQTAMLFSAENFTNDLFSCQVSGQDYAVVQEGDCFWMRPQGRFLDRDGTSQTIGFQEQGGGVSLGGQSAVAENWHAGFALGYERSFLDTATGAESDSRRFHAGGIMKYQNGPLLLAGAVTGGIGHYETTRRIGFGGVNPTSTSDHDISYVSTQIRAAYLMEHGGFYAKPLVDLGLTYLDRDSVNETGDPASDLVVQGGSDTVFSATPAFELGSEHALTETQIVRAYVRAGVTFYTDTDHALSASFAGAPADTPDFRITSKFDDTVADIEAGLTLLDAGAAVLQIGYQGHIAQHTDQHGGFIKGSVRF